MAIQGVETKCYILALFVRDDDERFLLGSGHYEFKDSQKQFSANTIQNDVVEVQGNDGFLLAGQVRRPGTQSFDGYIGDGTTEKTEVEEYRRQFFGFFRKNHFYRVIYVFPDGSAIQRKRGFLVDDATVQELYQQYPEYHVALNFEDVNYYTYSENEQGEEIYAEEAQIDLSSMVATGGLVWDEYGAVSEGYAWGGETTVSGTEFTVQNDLSLPAPITDARLNGDTYQQTYSGKNLIPNAPPATLVAAGITWTITETTISGSGTITGSPSVFYRQQTFASDLQAGTYTFSIPAALDYAVKIDFRDLDNVNHSVGTIAIGSTSTSFTTNFVAHTYIISITRLTIGGNFNYSFANQFQLEAGSTATAYEPYVGGIPAPSPDYPQDVQTVTGEQTVTVSGKNLLKLHSTSETVNGITYTRNADGTFNISGTATANTEFKSDIIPLKQSGIVGGQSYTISSNEPINTNGLIYYVHNCNENGSWVKTLLPFTNSGTRTAEVPTADYVYFVVRVNSGKTVNLTNVKTQIERGSTATDFAPYQTPQSYSVSLGSTELCKIGDHQDYIYKGADGWYVHKAIGKLVLDGSNDENWGISYSGTANYFYRYTRVEDYLWVSTDRYKWVNNMASPENVGSTTTAWGSMITNVGELRIRYGSQMALADWKTKLATEPMVIYYASETPTDTHITDTTLVSQLNALGSAKLMVGENNVLVSATDTNLQAELQIKYYSTVSFDGAGFVWEEGGSGGPTTVEIDSITNVYPIWTVKGPAVNPELSVITTNTTLRYEGSVGANQTLVIDMMNKTAKINGTSVIGNVTGDWVNFTPGINRVVYITDNADTPPSLIEWQEVVG